MTARSRGRRLRRLRRWQVAAAVLVAAAVAAVVTLLSTGSGGTPPLRADLDRPSSYQITYRVNASASGRPTTTWEVLTVHRPFSSSDLLYTADPRLGAAQPTSATWFDVDGLYTLDGTGTVRKVAGRQPGPSGSDQALGVELPELAQRHLAKNTGHTLHVAGRTCTVVRFLEPPVGPIKALKGSDHDDLCIDGTGLVLSEHWVLRGRTAYTRTAVLVLTGTVTDPELPTNPQALPGSSPVPVAKPGVDPHSPVAAPPAPPGYTLARTDVFTLPAPSGAGLAAMSTVWAFTSGGNVISVEAGTEAGGQYPWTGDETPTTSVTLAHLGAATTALRSDGPEIRVVLGPGTWVRIRGTVPLAQLLSYSQLVSRAH